MDNEAWRKLIKFAWKFGIQNLVVTCTLNLRWNLEHFLKSILGMLFIVSKLRKSGVQNFKWCANWSWNEEVMAFEDNCAELKDYFEMISKFNLWIQNLIRKDPNFELTHYYFGVLPSPPQELHLGHFIHPKWTPHN